MCGIYCSLLGNNQDRSVNDSSIDPTLQAFLHNRGPDCHHSVTANGITFHGFVLWQQGSKATPQPLESSTWILLMNGDIFNADKSQDESDTSWLLGRLDECRQESDILQLFADLKGPFSIIAYNKINRVLHFGRDALGRNSLLLERTQTEIRIMSSSYCSLEKTFPPRQSIGTKCVELPPLGIFKLSDNLEKLELNPWSSLTLNQMSQLEIVEELIEMKVTKSEAINPSWLITEANVENAFDFYTEIEGKPQSTFAMLMENKSIKLAVDSFLHLLRMSVRERVQTTPRYCAHCIREKSDGVCHHAKVGILFSGGIDCTILAALAHQYVDIDDPIELLNVAFETTKTPDKYDVPDRCSAKESLKELTALFPKRSWNMVEVNVTREEQQEELRTHIKHQIYPLNTVLDESLGCAFWFASRGRAEYYETPCRVVLVGSGADELFGGYTRHRNAYDRCKGTHADKIVQLRAELEMDWERIPLRNLGRDDRVIADNGKTARAPFIQEDVVSFVRSMAPEQRCCFSLKQGIGDKLFLRLCGHELGLRTASILQKRAIQFGSRIANKNQNAKDVSAYLL